MIKIEDVTFAYRKGTEVLTDTSATFGDGLHLLLGANGAGKSTLLRLMAGLLVPQSGKIYLAKEVMACHSPHAVKEIFMLTDDSRFPLDTIDDMVRRHAPFYPKFSSAQLRANLAEFGMTGSERLADMSLGSRHKANVAYALALGTRFLLLDEPANGLDMASKQALSTIIGRTLAADGERSIIIATHTVQEMRNLFDTVTILDHGHIVMNTSVDEICERLAFISDPIERTDAFYFQPAIDGPSQVVPNDGTLDTPVDFTLLFMAATGVKSQQLKDLLK